MTAAATHPHATPVGKMNERRTVLDVRQEGRLTQPNGQRSGSRVSTSKPREHANFPKIPEAPFETCLLQFFYATCRIGNGYRKNVIQHTKGVLQELVPYTPYRISHHKTKDEHRNRALIKSYRSCRRSKDVWHFVDATGGRQRPPPSPAAPGRRRRRRRWRGPGGGSGDGAATLAPSGNRSSDRTWPKMPKMESGARSTSTPSKVN